MKRLLAAMFGVVLLVGGSIAFAGGYEHTSDDDGDDTEQVETQDVEAQEDGASMDAPGQQVATGAEYTGSGPRGLEVAQIAIADHKGSLPAGLSNAISGAGADHGSDHAQGAPDDEQA